MNKKTLFFGSVIFVVTLVLTSFTSAVGFQNVTEIEPVEAAYESSNQPPTAPIVTGPSYGNIGIEYEWTFFSTDPEGDNITYYIDWGDKCGGAEYHGPYPSGEEAVVTHTYAVENTFILNTLAIDEHGAESNWTYFEITMPKNKVYISSFILRLLENFPNMFSIIKHLFRL